jgi:hypothetical protein
MMKVKAVGHPFIAVCTLIKHTYDPGCVAARRGATQQTVLNAHTALWVLYTRSMHVSATSLLPHNCLKRVEEGGLKPSEVIGAISVGQPQDGAYLDIEEGDWGDRQLALSRHNVGYASTNIGGMICHAL